MKRSIFESNSFTFDKLFPNLEGTADFGNVYNNAVRFLCDNQLYLRELWTEFAEQFRSPVDDWNYGWRCEYWGKMMRGAALVCAYTHDDALYEILESTVRDILSCRDEYGRISTYSLDREFSGWDLWGRKYVLLGLQYFYEICRDTVLKNEILTVMCGNADYILEHIGKDKKQLIDTSFHWLGINSMSILEPIVRLYNATRKRRYLDFASYLVDCGYNSKASIFAAAYEDKLLPCEYPTNKAYEMMSCFEGLAEYSRLRRDDKYKITVINFGRRVIESEISVIGCCGCTHELFDHTVFGEVDESKVGIMQETCVTVTLMKFCSQLLRITGDIRYADCIEKSFFNAYLGSFNTQKIPTSVASDKDFPAYTRVLPIDSYSPLRPFVRGKKVGGFQRMRDGKFYGCCVCIAAAGVGIIPRVASMMSEDGVYLNLYLPGYTVAKTPDDRDIRFSISGNYPYGSRSGITIGLDKDEEFTIFFRIPSWSRNTKMTVNGKSVKADTGSYTAVRRKWSDGDKINITFDINVYPIYPDREAPCADKYIAFAKGAIVLAADARTGVDPDGVISPVILENGTVKASTSSIKAVDTLVCENIYCTDGKRIKLIDYSLAGKTYDERSRMAAWLKKY